MILIYVPKITARLKYIFDFLFKELSGIEYTLTTNEREFLNSSIPKLAYGDTPVKDTLYLKAQPLLFQETITKQPVEFRKWNQLPVFFPVDSGVLPFDLFACSFFLISRYEEYFPGKRDRHNRYRAEESVAYKGGFLERPIINLWMEEFKKLLIKNFPELIFPTPAYSFIPTIDIDNAYAYKYKGKLRTTLNLLKKLGTFKFKKFSERLAVLSGSRKDPYDSYEKLLQIHSTYKVQPLYFILLGDYSKYDRNLSYDNKNYISLIQSLHQYAKIGIHPSYKSNNGNGQLSKEKQRLEAILGKKVIHSRQHYIKLEFPATYRNLITQGIKEDYSMGYPSRIGFRAGTSSPFYFFDLEKNERTSLKIFPFVVMDSMLKYYMKIRAKEVIPHISPIIEEIKRAGGNFIFVFHNESLGESKIWKNWGNVYENMIKLAMTEADLQSIQ